MNKSISALIVAAAFLSACVNPERVSKTTVNDNALTCAEITTQLAQVEEIKAEAAKGTGMSGTNVAAALLFWPAAVGNYMNGSEALNAAEARKQVLVQLSTSKKCL